MAAPSYGGPSPPLSEWVSILRSAEARLIRGHFGDESFQVITCTGTDSSPLPGSNRNSGPIFAVCGPKYTRLCDNV